MAFAKSQRLQQLPPYLFIEIDKKKRAAIAEGKDVINLGVGDPDRPTPQFIIDRMTDAIRDPANHCYPFDEGVPAFRKAAALWMKRRFGVSIEAENELIATIGSKDGIAHLPLAVVNPGEHVLVPQPGYPVYSSASSFAGGVVHIMDLLAKNHFLPDLDAIPKSVLGNTALMFLNYPNNPTAAIAPLSFYEKAVALAKQYDFVIASDAAYSELYFESPPPSILQVDGAKDVTVEFFSLSKTFNMTGWRIGFAVGAAPVIAGLAQVKGNCDSGQFNAIQHAGVAALEGHQSLEIRNLQQMYQQRRDTLISGFTGMGFAVSPVPATFYTWIRCQDGYGSMKMAGKILEEADVVTIPGIGFGQAGEGYIRCALTVDENRISEAIGRISKIKF